MLDFALWILVVLICIAAKGSGSGNKPLTTSQREKAWRDNMTNIDPVTGDYTSRRDGLRYDKYGCLKWRD